MSRKSWILTVTVALAMFALLAEQASAKIKFEWQVGGTGTNGTLLAAGQSRSFTSSTDGKTLDFHSAVAGIALLLLSSKVTVDGGKIIGGTPGTNEETVLFENVTVDPPLNACTAETGGIEKPTPGIIATHLLSSQIVEGETSHEPLILFSPKTGGTWFTIKFLGASCAVAGAEGEVTGNILARPLPELKETLNGDLDFEAPAQTFLLFSGGSAETAGLKFAGSAIALTGLTLNILTTDEKYSAF